MSELDSKKFSQIGIISYLRQKPIEWIIQKFKSQVIELQPRRKHEIRQRILSTSNMNSTKLIVGDLKVTINHLTYKYTDQLDAVILDGCRLYHPLHIKYVAQKISQTGKLQCPQCKAICQITNQIILDTFVLSYFQKVKNYEGSVLIFKKQKIGSMLQQQALKKAIQSQQNTIVQDKQSSGGVTNVVQVKVLQIDSKDDKLKDINTQMIAQKLQNIQVSELSKNFIQRQLISTNQILMNLICFQTNVRIRNPLIHKNCKPSDHKNRLILYSYEQIYALLFGPSKKKKTIKCIFPRCTNYFDQKNFYEVSVVPQNIHNSLYQQKKQCIYGQYFSGMYQKNWHYHYTENMLSRIVTNRSLISRYSQQIKEQVISLLSTTNLRRKFKIYKELYEISNQNGNFHQSIKLFQNDKESKIVIVDVGESNLCPVRCKNCKNLNAMDAHRLSYQYKSSPDRLCPLCGQSFKKSPKFYDAFMLDMDLMKFIFLQGHNRQILHDIKTKTYYHKLSYYTGRSLRQKLKQQNKQIIGYFRTSEIDIKLNRNIRYVPVMDRRCGDTAKQTQYNKHFVYLPQNQKIKDDTKCPFCDRQLRSDTLYFNEQLQSMLKANGNILQWNARKQFQQFSLNTSILSIKYYDDIKNQYEIKDQNKIMKFYWKNYQGTLIKFPVRFRGCIHSFQSTICDFSDIIYQNKVQRKNKFNCRFKDCKNQYSNAQQIQRVPLDIYSKIEQKPDLMRKIISKNEYWIEYNIQDEAIVSTSKKQNDENSAQIEQQIIQKYRSKADISDDLKNRKQIYENIKKIQQDINDLKNKINGDQRQFEQSKGNNYKYSMNEQQYKNSKQQLNKLQVKRRRLLQQRRLLNIRQQQLNRKANKTNNISFSKLVRNYQSQINELKDKKNEDNPFENVQKTDFTNYKTFGNIYPFQYPISKASAQVQSDFIKLVEQSIVNLDKKLK